MRIVETKKIPTYLLGASFGILALSASLTSVFALSSDNRYCEIWNATATKTILVKSFCFETSITDCVHVQVWYKDGPYTGDTGSIEQGLFVPDTNTWNKMCEGNIVPQVPPENTIVPPEICTPHILDVGLTRAYFVVGSECALDADISTAETTPESVQNMTTFEEGTHIESSESQCVADDPLLFLTAAPTSLFGGTQGVTDDLWGGGNDPTPDDGDLYFEEPVSTPNPTASPITPSPTKNPTTPPITSPPTKNPTAAPITPSPTKNPIAAPITTSPTKNPTKSPITTSTTKNPTKSPTTTSPTKNPTTSPITTSPTKNPTPAPITPSPTKNPTTSPTAPSTLSPSSSMAPTQCKYSEDPLTGLLLSCNNDEQCGGFIDPITNEQKGATCNPNTCECECDSNYCLTLNNNGPAPSNMCDFNCDCTAQCDVNGTIAKGECALPCTDCTDDADACSPDEDCILSTNRDTAGKSFCTDSGICTDAKNAMCDDAYEVATGSGNNRAKCCPATSGCIKQTFGVIKTATCGNSCGTSCLGYQSNPGNPGYMPTSFCTFGSRVVNMPYCPDISDVDTLGAGFHSCKPADDRKAVGDNSICCAIDPDPADDRGNIEGQFNCTEPGYGPLVNQVCVDSSALTCKAGRIAPTCDGTTGAC